MCWRTHLLACAYVITPARWVLRPCFASRLPPVIQPMHRQRLSVVKERWIFSLQPEAILFLEPAMDFLRPKSICGSLKEDLSALELLHLRANFMWTYPQRE